MFGKAQILIVAILASGPLFAGTPAPSSPVAEVVFTAFDTETTGFSPQNDRLVEIGAVRFRGNGEILAATNWLINPGRPIPRPASEVNGITDDRVAGAPGFCEVWPLFVAFCSDSVLLAHNAKFDVAFLLAELKRAHLEPPALVVGDTLPLFRAWFPRERSYSLEPLALSLGVQGDTYHRAEADAFHLIHIFNAGLKSRADLQLQQLEREAGGWIRLTEGQR